MYEHRIVARLFSCSFHVGVTVNPMDATAWQSLNFNNKRKKPSSFFFGIHAEVHTIVQQWKVLQSNRNLIKDIVKRSQFLFDTLIKKEEEDDEQQQNMAQSIWVAILTVRESMIIMPANSEIIRFQSNSTKGKVNGKSISWTALCTMFSFSAFLYI